MIVFPFNPFGRFKAKSKNTICLWFDKDAPENGDLYAATFPNSEVTVVPKAPADYLVAKQALS